MLIASCNHPVEVGTLLYIINYHHCFSEVWQSIFEETSLTPTQPLRRCRLMMITDKII